MPKKPVLRHRTSFFPYVGMPNEHILHKNQQTDMAQVFFFDWKRIVSVVTEPYETLATSRRNQSSPVMRLDALFYVSLILAGTMANNRVVETGAYSSTSVDNKIQEIALFAASSAHSTAEFRDFSSGLNFNGPLELVRVISVETQVVAGRNYKMKLELKPKGGEESKFYCDLVVWDQPWTNTRKITEAEFTVA